MDRARFPHAVKYLDRLPAGIESHPKCRVKAAVFVDQHRTKPIPDELLDTFPGRVVQLVKHPPPVSAWISEVVAMTYMVAIRDHHFPPGTADAAYEEWTYERNRRLLGGKLYRAVFLLVSPDRLFRHVGRRWSRIRQGSTLELIERGPGYAKLQSHYPSFLHDESIALGMRGALRAAGELAGAREVRITTPLVLENTTTFEVHYRE